MKYILLFCGTDEDQRAFDAMSAQDLRQRYAAVGRWFAEHGAKIRDTNQLQPPETATCVRFDADGRPMVTDGPFLEGKEVIGGYAAIDVADLDAAMAMAKAWPGRGVVEVRPAVER
jgi:hypothetical protein